MTYSFDVFDTCLCRLCGDPRMMLDVLSWKVVDLMPLDEGDKEHLREQFVALRADAHGDLGTVYSHVAQHYPLPLSVDGMVELEMGTEREMLVPIKATLQLVEQCRSRGDVIFISDMYLPASFIRERLEAFGFMREGDYLFVSDEVGALKRDGTLFQLIHRQLGIDYRHWHHYGDSRQSDFMSPRRLGIHAHRLAYGFLPIEERWRRYPATQFQFANLLAGVSRAMRLQSDAPDDMRNFVCDLAAPVMVAWTCRVMADATRRGIRKLYFFARDTHSEYHIARSLQPLFPNVEPHYLFVSGSSLYNDSPLRFDYLLQEGVADKEGGVAIVDSGSTGRGLQTVNEILVSHGYPKATSYLLWYGNAYLSRLEPEYSVTAELEEFYTHDMAQPEIHKVTGVRKFIELIFPMNFHSRTVGYERRNDGRMRPVFDNTQNGDDITLNNFRAMKRQSDQLLVQYADAFSRVQLHRYAYETLHQAVLPAFGRFLLHPERPYVDWLSRFRYNGKPYVAQLWRGKGCWQRGSLAYSLPKALWRWIDSLSGSRSIRRLRKLIRLIRQKG